MNRLLIAATAALLTATAQAPRAAVQAARLITPADLQADIKFLASPDLLGRTIGSPENLIAADFIASEFERLGLKPVGDDGTYFQHIDILHATLDSEHSTLTATVNGQQRTIPATLPHQSIRNMNVCGGLVFAGYGIDAPEYNYSDYAGLNVTGKVVVVLSGEPQQDDPDSKWMGTFDTWHAYTWQKIEEARKHGAAALIMVQDPGPPRAKAIPASAPRATNFRYAVAGQMWDIPVYSIRADAGNQLLAPANKTVADLKSSIDKSLRPATFAIPGSSACAARAYTDIQHLEGRNVVALLEGSDPTLKAQTILVTAHHDHMGYSDDKDGKRSIYYGADDNGSGIAGVLGTARAFVRGNVRPKRSVLFIAFDGEEQIYFGGSYYYTTHPIVPLADTAAILNMDMIGRNEDDPNWPTPADGNANMVNILGTRYNPAVRAAIDAENAHTGLKLDYKMDRIDPDALWSRSDHFWFAPLHIPQVEFQTGLHHDYHTINDTWERINYPKLTRIVQLVFLSVANLADTPRRPTIDPTGGPNPPPK